MKEKLGHPKQTKTERNYIMIFSPQEILNGIFQDEMNPHKDIQSTGKGI